MSVNLKSKEIKLVSLPVCCCCCLFCFSKQSFFYIHFYLHRKESLDFPFTGQHFSYKLLFCHEYIYYEHLKILEAATVLSYVKKNQKIVDAIKPICIKQINFCETLITTPSFTLVPNVSMDKSNEAVNQL